MAGVGPISGRSLRGAGRPLRLNEISIWTLGIAGALVVFGALPFLTAPTSLQAVWTMGFAESFANGPIWRVHAHEFGAPHPAPIAFGLAGAWPASLLLRLGLSAADAYTMMVAGWLAVAYWAAHRLARVLGADHRLAVLAAVSWLTMPVVWAHAHYSQLTLGIALLPLYLLPSLSMATHGLSTSRRKWKIGLGCFGICVIAAFMDGYTFVMLACGSMIVLAFAAITRPQRRAEMARFALPVQIVSLAGAYALYALYIGDGGFEAHPLDAFRAYALDLTYPWMPHSGMGWLADAIGFSVDRDPSTLYGDSSVWTTTFAGPALLAGAVAWWRGRREAFLYTALLVIAAFSFYMALGPSFKIAATRPEGDPHYRMPADAAFGPTGTGALSEHLPGFDVMRASYRWLALCLVAVWLLLVLRSIHTSRKGRQTWGLVLVALTALNIPDLPHQWDLGRDHRAAISRLDTTIVPELKREIAGERVLFAPWDNDFLINYLAPRAGFETFNIGGDKNLAIAQRYWPGDVLDLGRGSSGLRVGRLERLLTNGTVDAVVLPYFALPSAAAGWPCGRRDVLWSKHDQTQEQLVDPDCLTAARSKLAPLLQALSARSLLVSESHYFAVVRIRDSAPPDRGDP